MIERMIGVISKRANTRLSYPRLDTVVRCKEKCNSVELVNISSHGLRFYSKSRYKVGEKLWFDIKNIDEDPSLNISIKGCIINDYTNVGDTTYDYGVQFYRFRYMNEIEQVHLYVHKLKKKFEGAVIGR